VAASAPADERVDALLEQAALVLERAAVDGDGD
jgi:hypothetical protein